ncbi:MAG: tetratricopeptide repeat protein [Alphaproteobacteria bacterium]|nr:tetratricopeptide repeat protein [Alphaproteobacteria bacterium]
MSGGAIQLLQRATAAMERRSFGEAVSLCEQVIARYGEEPNALMLLGLARMEADDTAGAIGLYERARQLMPEHIHVLTNLGAAYRAVGRLNDARNVLEEALRIDRRHAIAQNSLGNVLLDLGLRDDAKRAYERAVAVQPAYAEPIAGLARIAEEEHRLDDARRLADRALNVAPQNVSAQLTRGKVQLRSDDATTAAQSFKALLGKPALSWTNTVMAQGHLGEAYERLGRFNDAFAAFSRANQLLAHSAAGFASDRSYLAPQAIVRMTAFVASLDAGKWEVTSAPPNPPVFLIGFPRSGTTLVDQILASHPQVTTLEERDSLMEAGLALAGADADFGRLAQLGEDEAERLRAGYWASVNAGLGGVPVRDVFVDKLPLNAVLLPVIHRLFPTAKIVLAVRDSRDCVLSCYQQRFGMNAAMFQLLRLETASAYYDAVMRLVQVCRAKLPIKVHEVRYEAVIGDFDTAVGSLLTFLELPWDDAVRSYAETAKRRVIATPSASQVVRPLYASSLGKWRNYRQFLEPVLPVLEPWVAAFGYEATSGLGVGPQAL